jgi:hypothetical protein
MKKTFLFLLLFLSIKTVAQDPNYKRSIDTAQIKYAEIVKVDFLRKTLSKPKKLTKKQYLDFAKKWNSSKKLGVDKYKIKYFLYLVLKNGKKRQFTIRDKKIQEANWATFDIGDKLYFDKIWNGRK